MNALEGLERALRRQHAKLGRMITIIVKREEGGNKQTVNTYPNRLSQTLLEREERGVSQHSSRHALKEEWHPASQQRRDAILNLLPGSQDLVG